MFISVVYLYFMLSLICKMYYKLIYDRKDLYRMTLLFKKEKQKKNVLVLEQFFYHTCVWMCEQTDINPTAASQC